MKQITLTPTEAAILDRTIERSTDPKTWCAGSIAANPSFCGVNLASPDAVKFCFTGHAGKAMHEITGMAISDHSLVYDHPLLKKIYAHLDQQLWVLNDSVGYDVTRATLIEIRANAIIEETDPS